MSEETKMPVGIPPNADWEKARPQQLPQPTYWPFFLAMGIAFIFWGLLANWVVLLAGLLVFVISLAGWINLMRHE